MTTKLFSIIVLFFASQFCLAQPIIHTDLIDTIVEFSILPQGEQPIRITNDGSTIYYNNRIGNIYSVNPSGSYFIKYSTTDHSLDEIYGMDYDNDKLYISGLKYPPGDSMWIGYIMSVDLNDNTWDTLVKFDPLYKATLFDHRMGFVKIKNNAIYSHLGSRTNAGELRSITGVFGTKNLREHYSATNIYKFPMPSSTINILEDSTWIANSGYLFATGVRNAFAADFDQNDDFYISVNSGRRDYPEPTYMINSGDDLGFPYEMAGIINALTDPNYIPSQDTFLLDPPANNNGYLNPDPNFPQPPPGSNFVAPLKNIGPDGDLFRNTHSGQIWDASDLGFSLLGISSHKSPTSLFFDNNNVLPHTLEGTGLQTNFTGDGTAFVFDIGEDLLSIKPLPNNSMSVTRLVSGFTNPMGVILIGEDGYVLDSKKIWKVIFKDCSPQQTVYLDQDHDGYGDSSMPMNIGICETIPNDYVENNEDCDDNNPDDMMLTVNQNPIQGGVYEAIDSIISRGSVPSNSPMVTFQAEEAIVFFHGFEVDTNGDFLAKLTSVPCNPNRFNISSENSDENSIAKNQYLEKTESKIADPQFFVFPNPSTNKTFFKYILNENSIVNINVYNIDGKLVANLVQNKFKIQGKHQMLFQTNQLSNGIYSVIFQTEKHLKKEKLIVINKN